MTDIKYKWQKIGEFYHANNFDLDKTYLQFPEIAESTIRRELRKYNASLKTPDEAELKVKETEKEAVVSGTAQSAEQLFKKSGLDSELWEMVEVEQKDNYWDVHMKLKNSVYQSHTTTTVEHRRNYQYYIKIKCRRKIDIYDWKKFKKDFMADTAKKAKPVGLLSHHKNIKPKNALEINIFDLHLGKLGWHEETGSQSYDVKIAKTRFIDGITGLLERATASFDISEIVFPIGNDFFNSDTAFPFPSTTKGTPQQDDLRWQQIYRIGRELYTHGINILKEVAPVKVKTIPGNHDFSRSFFLGDALQVTYKNDDNVTVDNSPNPHKFYTFGKNLIGYTHGNSKDIPLARLITLMPILVPELWAKSLFREWHLGDIHHKKVWKLKAEDDNGGTNIRYMRSLTGDDAWHHQKGFKGAIKGCEAYVWDYNWGNVANFNYNIIT